MKVKPGYKQTEAGVIPEDWSVASLASLGKRGRPAIKAGPFGSTLTKDTYIVEGYKVYGQEQVIRGDHLYGDYYISKEKFSDLKSCSVVAGDILLSLVGTAGRILVIPPGAPEGIINPRLIRFSFDRRVISPAFFQFLLETTAYQSLLARSAQGGTMGVLNASLLRPISIPLPRLSEQQAIAEALNDATILIKSLEQLLAKKRQIKQGAMQELLSGKKRLSEFEVKPGSKQTEVGVIPEDWAVLHIRDLVRQGPTNGYSGPSSDDARGTPTLSLAATSSGRLILNEATVKRMQPRIPANSPLFLELFDVLVQRSNTVDLVGTTAVFDGPGATYVYPDLMMRLRFRTQVTGQWFWRYANSSRGRSFFRSVAAGSTGSMPKISGGRLREMPVPIPPAPEQAAIVTILSDMDAEIAALEAKLAKARQVKQGMMQELLTGRIRLI